jgi:hypothetical protein
MPFIHGQIPAPRDDSRLMKASDARLTHPDVSPLSPSGRIGFGKLRIWTEMKNEPGVGWVERQRNPSPMTPMEYWIWSGSKNRSLKRCSQPDDCPMGFGWRLYPSYALGNCSLRCPRSRIPYMIYLPHPWGRRSLVPDVIYLALPWARTSCIHARDGVNAEIARL